MPNDLKVIFDPHIQGKYLFNSAADNTISTRFLRKIKRAYVIEKRNSVLLTKITRLSRLKPPVWTLK